ncbi:MAG: hypothetical protein KDD40_08640, partial [Bdellovibrionales bacterium]|nr:hypothetical protein [Bdellovibrionales bacterium]
SNDNAMQGLISMGSNIAMGYVMMKAYQGSCSVGTCVLPLLAMGLLSFAQSRQSGSAAAGSIRSGNDLDFCPECSGLNPGELPQIPPGYQDPLTEIDPATVIPSGPYKNVEELSGAYKDLANKIKNSGYTIDPAGQQIIAPDGTTTPVSAINDMINTGSGLSASEFALVKDTLEKAKEKINADYQVASMGFSSAGGSSSGSSYKFDSLDTNSALSNYLKNLNRNRKPAAVAGMKRMVNGEPIGVAGDDIFQMVHRRYQHKRTSNIFIEKLSPVKPAKRQFGKN